MKDAMIISLLVLFLIVAISANCIYMRRNADYIYSTALSVSLDAESDGAISELEEFWEFHKDFIALSISFQDMDRIGELIIGLREAYDSSNANEFERVRVLLANSSGLLIRYERFSLENIL